MASRCNFPPFPLIAVPIPGLKLKFGFKIPLSVNIKKPSFSGNVSLNLPGPFVYTVPIPGLKTSFSFKTPKLPRPKLPKYSGNINIPFPPIPTLAPKIPGIDYFFDFAVGFSYKKPTFPSISCPLDKT